jgi:Ser/Thr protein kinase RdoA (MazF antagonist)
MLLVKDISLDKPIARGRTADVYDYHNGRVLKLFHDWFGLENIEYELKVARAVHVSGVSAPAVIGGVIQVQGRNGLIYERIAGRSMLEVAPSQPWMIFALAKRFAALHANMHDRVFAAEVPTQRNKLEHRLQHVEGITDSLRLALLERLASLPDGDRVCHGDFHPGNVLSTQRGDMVIDWIDASRGNPLADVARTSIILLGIGPQGRNPFLKIFVRIFHSAYLRQYFHLRPSGEAEYRRWLPIVAAARLSEGIKELEQWLIGQARKIESPGKK